MTKWLKEPQNAIASSFFVYVKILKKKEKLEKYFLTDSRHGTAVLKNSIFYRSVIVNKWEILRSQVFFT